MSFTAHRVIEFRFEHFGFDLGHNEKFSEFLEKEEHLSFNFNPYGTGLFDVLLETLERAITMTDELCLDEDTVIALNADITIAKSARKEFVTYYCC